MTPEYALKDIYTRVQEMFLHNYNDPKDEATNKGALAALSIVLRQIEEVAPWVNVNAEGGLKFEMNPIVRQFLMTDDLVLMASASAAGKAYVDVIIPTCNAVAEGAEKEGMSLYNRDQMVQMFIAGSAWKEGLITKEVERLGKLFSNLHSGMTDACFKSYYEGKTMAMWQLEHFINKLYDDEKDKED